MSLVEHVTEYIRRWPIPAEIKLTAEQYDEVKANTPVDDRPQWQRPSWAAYFATAVVVVETVEKSTPHEEGWLTT